MGRPIPCMLVRGGTSKGVYLDERDLPAKGQARDELVLSIFGSPDTRQIDGLGGADPLTSKVCLIGPPPTQGAYAGTTDISYTFGQVSIDEAVVDYRGLCGNLTTGVGVYALWAGLVQPAAPVTAVRIYNTNLGRQLTCEVPVEDGRPLEVGDYVVPGVPGSGAKITVDFSDTGGGATGALLPTGNTIDTLDVPGVGQVEASLVDIGNAHVFVRAADLDLTGTETAAEIDADQTLCERLETIRAHAAHAMGMVEDPERALAQSLAVPMLALVAPPQDYRNVSGEETVSAERCDLLARLMFMQQAHKAYAATSTVCTGVASRLRGTVVNEVCERREETPWCVRIGHPAGVVETETVIERGSDSVIVKRATLGRTARRLMEGTVFV
jgi:2-methylaconitate cis-trans-isomerase PrpF